MTKLVNKTGTILSKETRHKRDTNFPFAILPKEKKTFAYIDNKKQNDYLIDLIKKYGNCVNNELTGKKNLTEFKVKKFKENAIYKNSKIKILKIINDISHTN